MLLAGIIGAVGLTFHNLNLCGWSIWGGGFMLLWALDGFIGEKWKINTPASMLDHWLSKWWWYDRIKKWLNKILKRDGLYAKK